MVVMVGERVEVVIVSLDWIGLDRIVLIWTRERRSGDPVGLIIRSIVGATSFFLCCCTCVREVACSE